MDPLSRGLFMGLNADMTRGDLFRAVLEGIALEGRSVFEPVLGYAGVEMPDHVIAIGGMSRNALFMQIKADVFNREIEVPYLEEEPAAGAALLGALAAGNLSNFAAAANSFEYDSTLYVPVADQVEEYDALFLQVYSHIYPAISQLNRANARLAKH
jgi:xylulokinase